MTLINPNGFDNLTQISGIHMEGMTNDDVKTVVNSNSLSTNFPSIICDSYENTEIIEFTAAGLRRIDENSFENCKNLRKLDLEYNEINEISENAFVENLDLFELKFYKSSMHLPRNIFANQAKLWFLGLGSNITFPNGIFDTLTRLDFLGIFDNKLLTDLPQNIFSSLTKLESLYLFENNLETIHSDSFGVHNNLVVFYFDSNNINAFDERLFSNTRITNINGAYNPCILRNSSIADYSPDRSEIRAALARCFANYEPREETTTMTTTTDSNQNQCKIGDLDNRVCYLEDESEDTRENFVNLKLENERLDNEIQSLSAENEEMRNKIENIEEQMEALKDLVLDLINRPCTCK